MRKLIIEVKRRRFYLRLIYLSCIACTALLAASMVRNLYISDDAASLLALSLGSSARSSSSYTFKTDNAIIGSKLFQTVHKPTRVIPFYYSKHQSFPTPSQITLTTIITVDRFDTFIQTIKYFEGPISVTLHIQASSESDERFIHTIAIVSSWISKYRELFQRQVDLHLIIDEFPRQFNYWRNVARLYAQTNYVLMLDVDFAIMTRISAILENPTYLGLLEKGNTAFVIPALEFVNAAENLTIESFPRTKQKVVSLFSESLVQSFHGRHNKGHSETNLSKWLYSDSVYPVSHWNPEYEPYAVFNRLSAPWCDERFNGYGRNKAACWFEMYLSGMDILVLPNDFLIHQRHPYPEIKRKAERRENRILYLAFRDELCARYEAMHAIESTPITVNWRQKYGCGRSAVMEYATRKLKETSEISIDTTIPDSNEQSLGNSK